MLILCHLSGCATQPPQQAQCIRSFHPTHHRKWQINVHAIAHPPDPLDIYHTSYQEMSAVLTPLADSTNWQWVHCLDTKSHATTLPQQTQERVQRH